jgi:hypothetical protein
MTIETDESLLRAWLAGDRKSGDVLMRRQRDGVARFFRFKVGGEVGRELTQETFFAVQYRTSGFRPRRRSPPMHERLTSMTDDQLGHYRRRVALAQTLDELLG